MLRINEEPKGGETNHETGNANTRTEYPPPTCPYVGQKAHRLNKHRQRKTRRLPLWKQEHNKLWKCPEQKCQQIYHTRKELSKHQMYQCKYNKHQGNIIRNNAHKHDRRRSPQENIPDETQWKYRGNICYDTT